jgi:hypothetical protein
VRSEVFYLHLPAHSLVLLTRGSKPCHPALCPPPLLQVAFSGIPLEQLDGAFSLSFSVKNLLSLPDFEELFDLFEGLDGMQVSRLMSRPLSSTLSSTLATTPSSTTSSRAATAAGVAAASLLRLCCY